MSGMKNGTTVKTTTSSCNRSSLAKNRRPEIVEQQHDGGGRTAKVKSHILPPLNSRNNSFKNCSSSSRGGQQTDDDGFDSLRFCVLFDGNNNCISITLVLVGRSAGPLDHRSRLIQWTTLRGDRKAISAPESMELPRRCFSLFCLRKFLTNKKSAVFLGLSPPFCSVQWYIPMLLMFFNPILFLVFYWWYYLMF
jgi:hypothetical protein